MILPFLDSLFDLATLILISSLIVLSVLSLCFIFHLRLKSQILTHLQDFNSLWTVRFLLVLFISLWAITELLRIPFFRLRHLYPFLPFLPLSHQADLCKFHIVLSLGFFQPAFLVILLFLLNASIRRKSPNDIWAISFVLSTCLPIAFLQSILLILRPFELRMSLVFYQTSFLKRDDVSGTDIVLCAYPLLNSAAFAVFGVTYAAWFVCSSWKVSSLVINKGLRIRIYGLASAVLGSLTVQIVALGLTALWKPDQGKYAIASLVVFVGAFCSAVAGEGILVIKPISDALDAGGCCCQFPRDGDSSRGAVVGVRRAETEELQC